MERYLRRKFEAKNLVESLGPREKNTRGHQENINKKPALKPAENC